MSVLSAILAGKAISDELGTSDDIATALGIKTARDPSTNLQIKDWVSSPPASPDVLDYYQSQIDLARAEGDHSLEALDSYGDRVAVITANASQDALFQFLGGPPVKAPMPPLRPTVGRVPITKAQFLSKLNDIGVLQSFVEQFGEMHPVQSIATMTFAGGGNRTLAVWAVSDSVWKWAETESRMRQSLSTVLGSQPAEATPPPPSGESPGGPITKASTLFGGQGGLLLLLAVAGWALFGSRK